MEQKVNKTPTPEQIRMIYKDTYNFYLKWKDINKEEDWDLLVKEEHELYKKYPFDLCKSILVEILTVIKNAYEGAC